MRRVLGALFVLIGAFCLYEFAVLGIWYGRELDVPIWKVPLLSLGRNYPADAGWLAGALVGIFVGIGMSIRSDASTGGGAARVFLVNAILLCAMLCLAYFGARSLTEETKASFLPMVGVFFGTALLQIGAGVILLILALFERPKGALSLLLGLVVYLAGAAAGVTAFLWGA